MKQMIAYIIYNTQNFYTLLNFYKKTEFSKF